MAFNGLVWRIMYRICVDLSLGKTYDPILGTKGGDPGESGWIRHVWCAKMKNHGRYFNHIQSKSKSTCQAIQSIYSIYQESWRQVTNKLTQALQPDSQCGWNPGRPKSASLKIGSPTTLMIISYYIQREIAIFLDHVFRQTQWNSYVVDQWIRHRCRIGCRNISSMFLFCMDELDMVTLGWLVNIGPFMKLIFPRAMFSTCTIQLRGDVSYIYIYTSHMCMYI